MLLLMSARNISCWVLTANYYEYELRRATCRLLKLLLPMVKIAGHALALLRTVAGRCGTGSGAASIYQ